MNHFSAQAGIIPIETTSDVHSHLSRRLIETLLNRDPSPISSLTQTFMTLLGCRVASSLLFAIVSLVDASRVVGGGSLTGDASADRDARE